MNANNSQTETELLAEIQMLRRQVERLEAGSWYNCHLEMLKRLSSNLRQALTHQEMALLLLEHIKIIFEADVVDLLLLDAGDISLLHRLQPDGNLIYLDFCPSDELTWQVVRTGQPIVVDVLSARRLSKSLPLCCYEEVDSVIAIPVRSTEAVSGVIFLGFRKARDFDEADHNLLSFIAEIAGNALDRAKAMSVLEQRAADRARELSVLFDVTAVTSQTLETQEMLQLSLQAVLRGLPAGRGAIHLADENGIQPLPVAQQSQSSESEPVSQADVSEPDLINWVFQNDDLLVLPARPVDPRLLEEAGGSGRYAYIGSPIRANGKVLGVLSLFDQPTHHFKAEDVALISSVADHIGVAVQNAQLNLSARHAAILSERNRLARDLHDSVLQQLYSMTLFARASQAAAGAGNHKQTAEYLARIGEAAQGALKEMRLLVYELRPLALEFDGIKAALENRISAVEKRVGIQTQITIDDDLTLQPSVEEDLYRIAQESLSNILKHAEADSVEISIRCEKDRVEMRVVDNGCGFQVDKAGDGSGMGLTSMYERAERMGGDLQIQSTPGRGTSVILVFPFRSPG